jgi:hypothetical protein
VAMKNLLAAGTSARRGCAQRRPPRKKRVP